MSNTETATYEAAKYLAELLASLEKSQRTTSIASGFIKYIKDTHREKAPSSKTPTLSKSMNMDVWVVGTSSELFIRDSETETKFSQK